MAEGRKSTSNGLVGLLVIGLIGAGFLYFKNHQSDNASASTTVDYSTTAAISAPTTTFRDLDKVEGIETNKHVLKQFYNKGAVTDSKGIIREYQKVFTKDHYVTEFKIVGTNMDVYNAYLANEEVAKANIKDTKGKKK
jgi:hypothetical protein